MPDTDISIFGFKNQGSVQSSAVACLPTDKIERCSTSLRS